MPILPFSKIRTIDADIRRFQDAVGNTFKSISDQSLINGELIKDFAITAGQTNTIAHRLDRMPVGYLVVDRNADANIWTVKKSTDKFIYLDSSLTCSISLWVF